MRERFGRVIDEHGRLAMEIEVLGDDADLYEAGMTSEASVYVMVASEDEFDVEISDSMLTRSIHRCVSSIAHALEVTIAAACLAGPAGDEVLPAVTQVTATEAHTDEVDRAAWVPHEVADPLREARA